MLFFIQLGCFCFNYYSIGIKISIIELKKQKNEILAELLVIETWYVLAFKYVKINVNIECKGLMSLILTMTCIYL